MKSQTVFVSQIITAFHLKWTKVRMIKLDILLLALITGLMLPAPTMTVQYVEDFEYETPSQNTFTNGVFQHNIVPMAGLDYTVWEISDFGSPPDGKALDLWPAIDEVMFDLNPGQYVDCVTLDFVDWGGNTTFEASGTLGTYSWQPFGGFGIWDSADTSGQNLGGITMVKLSSYEEAFDNLTINIVPEPSTFLPLGLKASIMSDK